MKQPTFRDLPEHLSDWGALWGQYVCQDGSGHVHTMLGDVDGDGIEGTAEQIAEQMATCEDKHIGPTGKSHGFKHSQVEIDRAYHAVVASLLSGESEMQWTELRHNAAMYEKWGDHMPKVVLMPDHDDPTKTTVLVTDQQGDPHLYDARKGTFELPDPRDMKDKDGKPIVATPSDYAGWLLPKENEDG